MAEPFLAEIRLFSFVFPPRGWALCNGQLLPIAQNQALFSLLGTTYGGNGTTNFALPNLNGRSPFGGGMGGAIQLGQQGGQQSHTLSLLEVGGHGVGVDAGATTTVPTGATPARGGAYADTGSDQTGSVGGGQPHENMAPFLVLNYCIALQGIFPSRT